MERMAWTDERLDDLSRGMDAGFTRLDADIRELRAEIGSVRVELRTEVGSLRSEMHDGFAAMNRTLHQVGAGIIIALVGVIAATLLGG